MTHAPRSAVFYDDGRLSPLDDLRPTFDIRVGAHTGLERLIEACGLDPVAFYVRKGLTGLMPERDGPGAAMPINRLPAGWDPDRPVLVVNGRCHLPVDVLTDLEPGEIAVEAASGDPIALLVTPAEAAAFLGGSTPELRTLTVADRVLMHRPWDWIHFRDRAIAIDLALHARQPHGEPPVGVIVVGEHPPMVHPSATVFPSVVLDTTQGPVWIGPGATVRPGAVLCGPCLIGEHATVADKAVIRQNTSIGAWCKAGGEIGGTVFQGYSNKGHDGFLGDSWVGSWVNLGAGTVNSNLLNTYGEVKATAEPMNDREPTGRTFLGAVIGDHTKTAIGTRIMTGAMVHTANLYASSLPISGCAPGFCFTIEDNVQPYMFEKLVQTEVAMMARRKIQPTEAYLQRLADLHANAMEALGALDDDDETDRDEANHDAG